MLHTFSAGALMMISVSKLFIGLGLLNTLAYRFKGRIIFDVNRDMHPKELEIKNFTYNLPEERIAKYPLPERDLSKLLIYRNGKISEDIYRNIDEYIPENSLLVFNNTKVIQARLFFQNSAGAKIEIFCLEPAEANSEMASV